MTSLQDRLASPGRAESSGKPFAHKLALHSRGKDEQNHCIVENDSSESAFPEEIRPIFNRSLTCLLPECPSEVNV